jgi:hypothetical protein
MGIYALAFLGLTPFGSLGAGATARFLGAPWTVTIGSIVSAAAGLIVMRIMRPQTSTG